jgi:hypothetical protein
MPPGHIAGLVLVALLVCMSMLSRNRWLRYLTVVVLLGVSLVCQLAFEPIVRTVVSARVASGEWSADYSNGAVDYLRSLLVIRAYLLLVTVGLAGLTLANFRGRAPLDDKKRA